MRVFKKALTNGKKSQFEMRQGRKVKVINTAYKSKDKKTK